MYQLLFKSLSRKKCKSMPWGWMVTLRPISPRRTPACRRSFWLSTPTTRLAAGTGNTGREGRTFPLPCHLSCDLLHITPSVYTWSRPAQDAPALKELNKENPKGKNVLPPSLLPCCPRQAISLTPPSFKKTEGERESILLSTSSLPRIRASLGCRLCPLAWVQVSASQLQFSKVTQPLCDSVSSSLEWADTGAYYNFNNTHHTTKFHIQTHIHFRESMQ